MILAGSARLRVGIVTALVFACSLAVTAGASAKKVTWLQSWKPSDRYLVTADLDGRTRPQLKPVAKVNYLHQGQWVKIACQTTGQTAYGSQVWTKVGDLYVPDTYVKTYTDGMVAGVPRCHERGTTPPSTPPPAPAGPSRATLAAAVYAVEYERVYGSNYGFYKERYPDDGIIWAHNGCSVPEKLLEFNPPNFPLGFTLSYYSTLFVKSCNRHDFGYRNYGSDAGGLTLDPTEARRKTIDQRFHENMDYQCDRKFSRKWVQAPQRAACHGAAEVFYQAVRRGGAGHFF